MKEELIEMSGTVTECLPNAMFKITLENQHTVLGIISGRMRKNRIQILQGDRVRVEMSCYDLARCRVTYRDR